jgi:ABC transporter transmembrane region
VEKQKRITSSKGRITSRKKEKLGTMGPRQKDAVLEAVSLPTAGLKNKSVEEEQLEEVRWTSEATTEQVSHLRGKKGIFCCGAAAKTKKVQTGADLGVWEKSLEDRSSLVGRWLLSYLNPLLDVGSNKVLDANDIGIPPQQDRADRAYATALTAWNEQSDKCRIVNEKRKSLYEKKLADCRTDQQRAKVKLPKYKEPSIAWALVKAFGLTELFVGLIYYVLSALLTFVPVLILSDLVTYFESGKRGFVHPWVEVVGLAVIPFTVSLLQTRHQTIYAHCAVFCRTAVSTLLYRKALKVSSAGRAVTSTGQVVNMMSNDTAQLQRFLQFVGMTVTAPLQIVIALLLIYRQVRIAAVAYDDCFPR